MSRRPLIAGNWKLHKTTAEATDLAVQLREAGLGREGPEVMVAPVFTSLAAVREALADSGIGLGAQNLHWEDQGAFTGEVSGPLLVDVGCTYVLVGHSERRQSFGDNDEKVRRRVDAALRAGLAPVICVGETLGERDAGRTLDIVLGQLDAALADRDASTLGAVVVAYEPVWAIGTGRTAAASDAQDVHAAIRKRVQGHYGDFSKRLRILYGGSVKPDNAAELLDQRDIDGALVGGASLQATSFTEIVRAAPAP